MAGNPPRVVVMIPTYNERENIEELVNKILDLRLSSDLTVLVVDDDSPDGTAGAVEQLAEKDGRIRLLLRKKRRGRGAAGIEGFKTALSLGADHVVEMDGDGSHEPRFIPSLLEAARTADIVLGSRFVKGGKDIERPVHRRIITRLVRVFLRRKFYLPVRDVTSGFRCFRREVLEKIDLDDLISVGPSVVLETLYKARRLGFSMVEVPIVFVDRKKGKTKLTALTLLETLVMAMKFKRIYR
jgi:dolichol-phosphate mannosyltransferase